MTIELPHAAIQAVWNFMQLHQAPCSADAFIVLGSIDDQLARPYCVVSRTL